MFSNCIENVFETMRGYIIVIPQCRLVIKVIPDMISDLAHPQSIQWLVYLAIICLSYELTSVAGGLAKPLKITASTTTKTHS